MDLASIEDVVGRWRPLSDVETGVALTLISDASAMIRAQYPGIDSQITAGQITAAVVASVVGGMVKRAMMRSDGVKSETDTVGPYTTTTTYDSSIGNLYLTSADMLLIQGYQPAAMSVPYRC